MANEVVRWEPFSEMVSLRDAVNRLFEDSFIKPDGWPLSYEGGMGNIPVDVVETKDNVIVKVSAPGMKPEDIDISVVGDTLTLKGQMKAEKQFEEGNYIRRERRLGSFQRTLSLPSSVIADRANADFENGILTLTLPKADEAKPKSIKVNLKK